MKTGVTGRYFYLLNYEVGGEDIQEQLEGLKQKSMYMNDWQQN